MADIPPNSKRPVCSSCSKPTRLCLCSRLRNPPLQNPVAVIILQHSLERKHPLNSARIAKLGLKNVNIATVSDVNFEARFTIRPRNGSDSRNFNGEESPKPELDKLVNAELDEGALISATIGKYGVLNSFDHIWMQQKSPHRLNIDEFPTSTAIRSALEGGFVVKKSQTRPLHGTEELEEHVEFEIEVPPRSVLLFPCESAASVDGFDFNCFDVGSLIVLDGTWAKAKRMYNENPWLRVLPHLKLDLGKMSLYGDVRQQPRVGFLSTIESIVYALKIVGNGPEGLDDLLSVFDSMIGDQRRCKDERLKSNG